MHITGGCRTMTDWMHHMAVCINSGLCENPVPILWGASSKKQKIKGSPYFNGNWDLQRSPQDFSADFQSIAHPSPVGPFACIIIVTSLSTSSSASASSSSSWIGYQWDYQRPSFQFGLWHKQSRQTGGPSSITRALKSKVHQNNRKIEFLQCLLQNFTNHFKPLRLFLRKSPAVPAWFINQSQDACHIIQGLFTDSETAEDCTLK